MSHAKHCCTTLIPLAPQHKTVYSCFTARWAQAHVAPIALTHVQSVCSLIATVQACVRGYDRAHLLGILLRGIHFADDARRPRHVWPHRRRSRFRVRLTPAMLCVRKDRLLALELHSHSKARQFHKQGPVKDHKYQGSHKRGSSMDALQDRTLGTSACCSVVAKHASSTDRAL